MNRKAYFLLPIVFALCACNGTLRYTRYKFRHQQGTSDYDDYTYYDDEIFDKDASVFNPHLASASISFAMASFASMSIPKYTEKSYNAKYLLESMGFTQYETNQWFKEKPGTDTIGLLAANKKVGDYTLVAFGIRGAAYFSEWASNFTIGNRADGYHDGFRTAADNMVTFMKEYIASKNISGDIKIWATGYSRAGATCNIASGLLDDEINKGLKPFGDNVNITRNHLYSYCFEAPQGAPNTKDSNGDVIVKSSQYDNIFNILNINDPVPLTAMKELGFTRYGTDLYLPDPLTVIDYQDHFNKMFELYNAVSNHDKIGEYMIWNFSYKAFNGKKGVKENNRAHKMSQGLYLRELVSDLVLKGMTFRNSISLDSVLEMYITRVQDGLRNLFRTIYESEMFKGSLIDVGSSLLSDLGNLVEIDTLISDLTIEGPAVFAQDFKPLVTRALGKLGLDFDVQETTNQLLTFIEIIGNEMFDAFLKGKLYQFLNLVSVDNIKSIGSGHYPELCAAHVRALDDMYVSNPFNDYEKLDGQYYKLRIEDETTSIVIKNRNNVIVNINNGDEINNRISYLNISGGYDIYLPYHEKYELILGNNVPVSLSYFNSKLDTYIECDYKTNSDTNITIG